MLDLEGLKEDIKPEHYAADIKTVMEEFDTIKQNLFNEYIIIALILILSIFLFPIPLSSSIERIYCYSFNFSISYLYR
jgi:hypothetical protein